MNAGEERLVPLPPRHDPGVAPGVAARAFHDAMSSRRSVRHFSDRPVSRETISWIVRAATTAPSGANKQPWRFVAVSDPSLKSRIRAAAEEEERAFYGGRASERWLADLRPFGTDESKPFLEVAPWLVAVFRLTRSDDGGQVYYGEESVGIAVGMLLAAAHMAGLSTLTHTPSPMRFLNEILGRPAHERPFLLIPIGHPAEECRVPGAAMTRRPIEDSLLFDPVATPR
jgi:iodotyrosine deiodinase